VSKSNALSTRSSGVLLHLSSLPGPHGVGTLGPMAREFVRFLGASRQRLWQMLPVSPVGGGFSPYDSPSAFAGNPMFVSLEDLAERKLLSRAEIKPSRSLARAPHAVYYEAEAFIRPRLTLAHARWRAKASRKERAEYEGFVHDNRRWLDDYCVFSAVRSAKPRGTSWRDWEPSLRRHEPKAVAHARNQHREAYDLECFIQFEFERQWQALRQSCAEHGVRLLGDIPMFVAYEGSDVWGNQELFQLDASGRSTSVAGVPPDYFSRDGQLWGNPLYRWDALQKTNFDWWVARFRQMLQRFDAVRLDHFIGFCRYWQIPANASSAKVGRFRPVPGHELLDAARKKLGALPFVAEDLGLVTEQVHALRNAFALPGMKVLQFGFGPGAEHYLPHNLEENTVVYTGTHDNDTLLGWLQAKPEAGANRRAFALERERALRYVDAVGKSERRRKISSEVVWHFLRAALMSRANTAVFPIQDVLGLGSEARMNVPGTPDRNWTFRLAQIPAKSIAERLAELSDLYQR
jgi:4-alpha-glucanotransferase